MMRRRRVHDPRRFWVRSATVIPDGGTEDPWEPLQGFVEGTGGECGTEAFRLLPPPRFWFDEGASKIIEREDYQIVLVFRGNGATWFIRYTPFEGETTTITGQAISGDALPRSDYRSPIEISL